MERFSLNNLSKVESKEQYLVEISNNILALANLFVKVCIDRAWKATRETIKISRKESLGYYELKNQKLRLDERCSKLVKSSQVKSSYITTDGQSASLSWRQAPISDARPIFPPFLIYF
jgi:hypothetical protein